MSVLLNMWDGVIVMLQYLEFKPSMRHALLDTYLGQGRLTTSGESDIMLNPSASLEPALSLPKG